MFKPDTTPKIYLSRSDVNHPLSSYSKFGFELDRAEWPSVEHYYQGMKFEDGEVRELIRAADHPAKTEKIVKKYKKQIRKDWKNVREVMMTRAVYTKCRTHQDVTDALLETEDTLIVETSMYDYFWGCGRDGRGGNVYGIVLMAVRDKLREEAKQD